MPDKPEDPYAPMTDEQIALCMWQAKLDMAASQKAIESGYQRGLMKGWVQGFLFGMIAMLLGLSIPIAIHFWK